MKFQKILAGAASIAALSLFALTVGATGASAYVTCNREGDCWHTDKKVDVPGVRFEHHPDDWYFHQKWDADKDHHYRDYHEGRGYYKNGVWITL